MITRIGRNDVVRVRRTGEVGTIKGWADHEMLDQYGTILDVQVSTEKVIQVNGHALDLVAFAPLKAGKLATWAVILVAGSMSAFLTYKLDQDLSAWVAAAIGGSFYVTFDKMLSAMFLRKRVRVTLPKTAQGRNPSRPSVGK